MSNIVMAKEWSWTRLPVTAGEILDAMRTMDAGPSWHQTNLVENWITGDTYIRWADASLSRHDEFGWDSAVCYAKRAVCRQIDALMVINHLGHFLSQNYPKKIGFLEVIGCDAPDILHELIIEPRNEIEHTYKHSTAIEAKRAVQLGKLFLKASAAEAANLTIVSYAASFNFRSEFTSTPSGEIKRVNYSMRDDASSCLLIDFSNADEHHALILRPRDREILSCSLNDFSISAAQELAKTLRPFYALTSFSTTVLDVEWLRKLKLDLNIPDAPLPIPASS